MVNVEELMERLRQRLGTGGIPSVEREALVQLIELLHQQTEELDALKRISLNLTSSLELRTVLVAVAEEAMRLLKNAHDVHIFLYQSGKLVFGTGMDSKNLLDSSMWEPRKTGLTYTVAQHKQPIIVEDMRDHPLFTGTPEDWTGSIIGIPLVIGDRVVGVMNLARSTTGSFSSSDLRLLQLLADQAAIAIFNAEMHEIVSRQAFTDILTGLPNRRALDARLDEEVNRSRRSGRTFAVVMLDLDGFKVINDTYGHAAGDMVLRETFGFLANRIRTIDFLARYGGDELTLLLPETDLASAQFVANRLQSRLRTLAIQMPDGTKRRFDLSGGIAVFPIHASTSSDLLRSADEALYRAKKRFRGQILVARGGMTGTLTA